MRRANLLALSVGCLWSCNPSIKIDLSGLEPLAVTGPQELAPLGSGLLDVKGGTPPYRFAFESAEPTSGTGATVDAEHGEFRIGARGRVTEVLRVTDAREESRTHTISVTDAIAIDPTRAVIDPGGIADFDAIGGHPPYTFRIEGLAPDRVDPATGIFEAARSGGRTTTVVVTDVNGAEARAEVQVTLTFGAGSNPHELAILDLTRDGRLDLVVAGFGSGDLVVLEGDGAGNFRRTIGLPMLTFPRALKVADLNDDGLMDLLMTGFSPSVLVALVQDPTAIGNLREVVRHPLANSPVDLDLVRLPDTSFAVMTVSESGRAVDRVELEIAGLLGANVRTSTRTPLPERGTRMVIGDFIGDGAPDMVVGVRRGAADPSLLLFYAGDERGGFATTPSFQLPAGLGTVALASGHLGGGPKIDLAATYSTSNELAIVIDDPVTGAPTIVRKAIGAGSGGQCEPCNRAGDAPCVSGGTCLLPKPGLEVEVCALSCGSALDCPNGTDCQDFAGAGRLCMPQLNVCPVTTLIPTGTNPRAVKIADLDLDGTNEVIVSVVMSKSLEIYRQGENGFYRIASRAATGNNPWEFVIDDLNGDAFPDVITANRLGNSISVLPGLGRLFTKTSEYLFGDSPSGTKVAQFDKDEHGANDVLVKLDGAFLTLLGDGRGGLTPYRRLEFHSPNPPEFVDLNGDGFLDFLSFHGLSRTLEFVPWEPGIGFTGGPETSTGIQPLGLALSDVDGDGELDALVANNLDYNYTLHRGQGGGAFEPYALDNVFHRHQQPDVLPRSVIASSDENGKLQYAVTLGLKGTSGTYLDALELDAAGQSTVVWSEVIEANGTNLTALDCNNDGRMDVLVTFSGVENNAFDAKIWRSFSGSGLELAAELHTGDPEGGQPGVFTATGPNSVAVDDFTGDGVLDLVITTNLVRRIFLFRGDGDCNFTRISSVATEGAISGLSSGDLDGDALPELTGTVEPDRFVVYQNLAERRGELRDFPDARGFCSECDSDADCGTGADLCADRLGMRTLCARDCSGGKACPRGFTCTTVQGAEQCIHEGAQCVY